MSDGLGRWGNFRSGPGAADFHVGDYRQLLRRHEQAATNAAQEGIVAVRQLWPHLFRRLADARNLRAAWDHLEHRGGTAPGRNGLRYEHLESQEVWQLMRAIGGALKAGTYRPGPDRKVRSSKGAGRGHRTLRLQDIEDRVVQRAIVQIVQPLLDPSFQEISFGFRPRRGRLHALATALALADQTGRLVWVVEDLKNAFDHVPRQRLFDILRKTLPEDVVKLIALVTETNIKLGLRQGSPLSPLLLNVYLDHFLDRPWRKLHADIPLLRTADDILLLCRTERESRSARRDLESLMKPAGMALKGTKAESIKNLNTGIHAQWLGFQIIVQNKGRLIVHIAERAWDRLGEQLALAHSRPRSPLRAIATLNGWLDQQGPCFPYVKRNQVHARLVKTALGQSFDEIPNRNYLLRRWRRAYARWCQLREVVAEGLAHAPVKGGSACPCSCDGS